MLSATVSKKLKKVLNPERFRFVVILYDTINDIEKIKAFTKENFLDARHKTLLLKDKTYTDIAQELYVQNTFVYIDDFSYLLEREELYLGFNQRRDKLASYPINLLFFYPKKLQDKLYKEALNLIPDLWEFRSAVIEVDSDREEIKDIHIKEDRTFLEYSGFDEKEKLVEIKRLEKKLENSTTDELKSHILTNMGFLYQELANYKKAEPLYLKALAIDEKVLGEEHPSTAATYNNLAGLYKSMGEYTKAEPLYLKALAICEKVLGEEHPSTAATYNNLAELYNSMGEYTKAEPLYLKALAICEKVLGEEHPSTASTYNNLAGLYNSMGEYTKAEPLYLKALAIDEKVLGEEHPSTAITYNNLALLYHSIGDFQKAYAYMKKAVDVREKVLPEEHPHLLTSKESLKLLKSLCEK